MLIEPLIKRKMWFSFPCFSQVNQNRQDPLLFLLLGKSRKRL